MKKLLPLFLIIAILSTFQSCVKDECTSTVTYQSFEPVYRGLDELKDEIRFVVERTLERPGKFYYYGNYVLISEQDAGVHIIDNSDIKNPKKLGFIAIEGNQDISLKENFIYADTRYNVLVIDISELESPKVVNCINNVKDIYVDFARPAEVIVDFVPTQISRQLNCGDNRGDTFVDANVLWVSDNRAVDLFSPTASSAPSGGAEVAFGAGSLSRMAIIGDFFYYINSSTMHIFDIEELGEPEQLNTVYLDWGVETIFPYQDKLFIGANNGMHIFDNSVPSDPKYLSTFAHARACDPVVVEGDIAYITLRDGSECTNFINQLDVVDVSDVLRPQLIASFPMHNPRGLSVRDNILYLCDADHGLKVFDVTEVETIHENQIGHVEDIFAQDVISVSPNLLLMIGEDGFYQYNTTDPKAPALLSRIATGQ